MKPIVRAVAFALAALFAAQPAAASRPVDDFEFGSFFVWSNGPYTDEEVEIGNPIHVLSDSRHVVCDATTGSATASLNPGLTFDDAAEVNLVGDGRCIFRYEWDEPIDLTENGANDRLVVELDAGVVGGQVAFSITNEGAGEAQSRTLTWAGHQNVVFYLDDFFTVDAKEALTLAVWFNSPAPTALYQVADIRLTANEVQAVNYEGNFVSIQTPPIPTPPIRFRLFDLGGGRLFQVFSRILDVHDVTGFVPPIHAQWEETSGMGGEIAGIYFERAGIQPEPFLPTTFRLSFDFEHFGLSIPELLHPPDPILGDRSLLLEFPVLVREAGSRLGTSNTRLVFDVHEGQPLQFGDVAVTPVGDVIAGTLTGFELEFSLLPTGTVDPDEKYFEATWISDWSPEGGVTGVADLAPLPSSPLTIVAAPSVTRAGTTLRASRPFDAGASIEIFDVSGRAIRRLRGIEGTRTVEWNGSTTSGELTPAGVYFLSVEDVRGRCTGRVTRIR